MKYQTYLSIKAGDLIYNKNQNYIILVRNVKSWRYFDFILLSGTLLNHIDIFIGMTFHSVNGENCIKI